MESSFSPVIAGPLTYNGILVMLAVAATLLAAVIFSVKHNTMDFRHLLLVSPFALFFGFLSARIFYVAFNDALFLNFRDKLALTDGGYALFGALLGAGAAIAVYFIVTQRKNLILPALDAAAVGGALGIAIGRWGNLLNEECYGAAVQNPAFQGFPFSVYVHAQEAYFVALFFIESLLCLLIFAALLLVSRKYKDRPGAVFCHFVFLYCGIRLVTESMRSWAESISVGPVRVCQVVAAVALIVTFAVIMRQKVRIAGFVPADIAFIATFVLAVGGGLGAEIASYYLGKDTFALLIIACALLIFVPTLLYASYIRTEALARQKAQKARIKAAAARRERELRQVENGTSRAPRKK